MITSQNPSAGDFVSGPSGWIPRIVGVGVFIAVVASVLSAAIGSEAIGPFVFRSWAQRVAGFVNGTNSSGIVFGFLICILSTAVALFAALVSSLSWRRRGGPGLAFFSGFLALVATFPVAVNLDIALGIGGSGMRAAQRILAVEAPGYLGAAAGGIVAGFGVFALVTSLFSSRLRRYFGPVRKKSSLPQGFVGHTVGNQPVYTQLGSSDEDHLVMSDQLEGRYSGVVRSGTNVLAIIALVLGIFGGVLAIPFGHVALRQIRRSGEQGRALAVTGLILGYISLAAIVGIAVLFLAATNQ